MLIHDVIVRCYDGEKSIVVPDSIDTVVVHRVGKDLKYGIDLGDTGPEVSDHFTGRNDEHPAVAKATGGQNAYTFMIGGDLCGAQNDGIVWQILPLFDAGAHAKRWNSRAVGIALIGDPRVKAPSITQRNSLVDLLVMVCGALKIVPDDLPVGSRTATPGLRCHDELKGSSSDPNKACPGGTVDMSQIRAEVRELMAARWQNEFVNAGVIT